MNNEWLDIAYINFDEAILHGQIVSKEQYDGFYMSGEKEVRQVLTEEQKRLVEDLNFKHQQETFKLLKGFVCT